MSEMVERVALAISGSDDPANILAIHRSRARAAIAVMREPTEEMLDRLDMANGGWAVREHSKELWQELIDVALK